MKISIEDIDLGETLGKGTVGEVYRGCLKSDQQEVAVKFLQQAISQDKLVRARFEREMVILERLEHPHVIKYFGGGEFEGRLFYAMEVLDGGNVRDLLDRYGSLSWREVASIARQVCSALQHAHNHGIIHRDLKPSNLFLSSDAQVKLGDFGIARDTHSADITSQGLTVGTHAYMPPEQIKGESNVTGKADLYSLGCVLFEMLSGQKPFSGTNFAVLFEQHLFKPAPMVSELAPDCPTDLVKVIDQLLEKDPDERPFNARSVQGTMLQLLDASSTSDSAETSPMDVGAGSVVDSGMELLRAKLQPPSGQQVSWRTLALVGIAAVILVFVAAMASSF